MEKQNIVLEEYRKGDFNKRLHLYLQFPIFREDFYEIDAKKEKEVESNQNRTIA